MKLRRNILLVLTSVAVMIGATAARGEEFYDTQLRLGRAAIAAGEPLQAATHCRIAAFGLMDAPPKLTESLVCLTLASSAAGREVAPVLERFLEVEKRFASYGSAKVEDTFRRSFESLLIATVDRERLAEIPSLAKIGAPQVVPSLPSAEAPSIPAAEAPVAEVPAAPEVPLPAVPSLPQEETAAVVEADDVLVAARRLINSGRHEQAAKFLYKELSKTPGRRDLRLLLLEAATLAEDWRTAAAQADLLQPFADGEENSMFYAAVALFETGRKADARRLVIRAKDVVPKTKFVRYYTRRIEEMR